MITLSTVSEKQPPKIYRLVAPKVETGNLFLISFPQEKILQTIEKTKGISLLYPDAIWCKKILFGDDSVTKEEKTYLLKLMKEQKIGSSNNELLYTNLVLIKQVFDHQPAPAELTTLITFYEETYQKLLKHHLSSSPNDINYIGLLHLLAAGTMLYPGKYDEYFSPELQEYLTSELADREATTELTNSIFLFRDRFFLLPNRRIHLKERYKRNMLNKASDDLDNPNLATLAVSTLANYYLFTYGRLVETADGKQVTFEEKDTPLTNSVPARKNIQTQL